MAHRVDRNGLAVAGTLAAFVEDEVLPGSGVNAEVFWSGLADLHEKRGQNDSK